jgi:hypothetical protein
MGNEVQTLREDVKLYDQKLIKKSKYVDELKEKKRLLQQEKDEIEQENEFEFKRMER